MTDVQLGYPDLDILMKPGICHCDGPNIDLRDPNKNETDLTIRELL